jgi:hypothetical protein
MRVTVHNRRGVAVEAAGHRFPPRTRTAVDLEPAALALVRARHGLAVDEPTPVVCTDCDRTFATERGLRTHRRAQHQEV